MPKCAFLSCNNHTKTKGNLLFFKVPTYSETVRMAWLNAIKDTANINNKDVRVCSVHFLPSDFLRGIGCNGTVKTFLKETALPQVPQTGRTTQNTLSRIVQNTPSMTVTTTITPVKPGLRAIAPAVITTTTTYDTSSNEEEFIDPSRFVCVTYDNPLEDKSPSTKGSRNGKKDLRLKIKKER